MMKYLFSIMSAFIFLTTSAFAHPHLFDAMELYEAGSYAEAARIFKNLHGPIAQPYKEELVRIKLLKSNQRIKDNFDGTPWQEFAGSFFQVSSQMPEFKKKATRLRHANRTKKKLHRELVALQENFCAINKTAGNYARMTVLGQNLDDPTFNLSLANGVCNSEYKFIDIRNIIALRLGNLPAGTHLEIAEVDNFFEHIPTLLTLLEDHDVADAVYKLAQLIQPPEPTEQITCYYSPMQTGDIRRRI